MCEDIGYIYLITNQQNNKKYIGQTNNPKRRWAEHKSMGNTGNYHHLSYLYNAMKKYGVSVFTFEIIEEVSIDKLGERENFWIEKLNTRVPNGYNILIGGRALCGENNPFYGKHHTEETKNKISRKNLGRKASEEEKNMRREINSKENNPFYGKHHTKETKDKIKQTCIQNGTYDKISKRMIGNNLCHLRKYKSVAMINPETMTIIRIFKNAMEAGEYIKEQGLTKAKHPSNIITGVCNGYEKKGAGYIWKYIDVEKDVSTKETE